jgi:signal transduction histidine kinase
LRNELVQAGQDSTRVERAMLESQGLLTTFTALLRIANIEVRNRSEGFSSVDLTALVHDVVEFYEPLAEAQHKALVLDTSTAIELLGDRDLLFQALANLLDNAIKYTPDGGTIRLLLTRSGLTVTDTGPGVPVEARQQIFRRFFRLEASRSIPGSGLGLSLVEAVARLHDMVITVSDNAPGTRIRLAFPGRMSTT